ncbi:hypothetical protein OS965_11120 [Streptomyces sp. H27-G5]|uniref:hypothetical protein n=1 Tax=Streptomyces sp. H27-G5 TaxID=2996698 RepID=UPI00226DE492|nr:hypothetical protein [Streptomyces sp. H27-G5]MCY0918723.1 hypothetical protein [Streptomyces sp. H27-G5]
MFGHAAQERVAGREVVLGRARPHLLDALHAELLRLGDTEIACGTRLVDPATLDADLVVGADGIHSVVRTIRFGTGSGVRSLRSLATAAWIGIAGFETGRYGETWATAASSRAHDTERRRSAQRVALASRTLHRFMTVRHSALRDALVGLLPG